MITEQVETDYMLLESIMQQFKMILTTAAPEGSWQWHWRILYKTPHMPLLHNKADLADRDSLKLVHHDREHQALQVYIFYMTRLSQSIWTNSGMHLYEGSARGNVFCIELTVWTGKYCSWSAQIIGTPWNTYCVRASEIAQLSLAPAQILSVLSLSIAETAL